MPIFLHFKIHFYKFFSVVINFNLNIVFKSALRQLSLFLFKLKRLISQESIQQIISRVDILDIVGTYVNLKKRGANYLGLCPFHNEKSPSFTVSPTKEIYKCFGCGRSGNSIGFLMDMEKYSYVEALRFLAQKYNVEIEETELSTEAKLHLQAADSLYIINSFAQKFFSDTLFETSEGQDIGLSYLKERGFREDIIKKFELGFNPTEKDSFTQAALKAQYNLENLQKAGLVSMRDGHPQDNYRGRIIFPIHNQSGKILGFGARLIKNNDRAPKYINTPENEIYLKSKILYGTYFARMAIDKADECLLVEGYTDVVSLHQAGIENVVASGGTSLTPDQLRLIKKYTNNLTILYDGDNAGVQAALRGLDLALEQGLNVKLVLIPDKEDPDSYVNKVGPAAFVDFIKENKKDFILFQLEQALLNAGTDNNKKAQVVNQIAETVAKINKTEEFTLRQDYVKQVSTLLKIEEDGFNSLVNKIIRDKITKENFKEKVNYPKDTNQQQPSSQEENSEAFNALLPKDELCERALLRSLLEFGLYKWDENQRVAEHIFLELKQESGDYLIENEKLLRIFEMYKLMYEKGEEPTDKNFLYLQDNNLNQLVISVMESNSEISPRWNEIYEGKIQTREDLYREEVVSTLDYLKLRKIKKIIEENERYLESETNLDEQLIALQTHQVLKQMEIELTKRLGTVIFK